MAQVPTLQQMKSQISVIGKTMEKYAPFYSSSRSEMFVLQDCYLTRRFEIVTFLDPNRARFACLCVGIIIL